MQELRALQVLTVIDVSLSDAAGCIRLFPAVLALAKSFVGFAAFARLLGDSNEETKQLMKELSIQQVGAVGTNGQPVLHTSLCPEQCPTQHLSDSTSIYCRAWH